jgi:hypothetical protein
MQGLESAILTIFHKSADGLNWPCPVSSSPLKTLSGIEFFLFWVSMNPYNTWMAELEVASFLSIRSVYRQCE